MSKLLLLLALLLSLGFASASSAILADLEFPMALKKVSSILSKSLQTMSLKLPLLTSCFVQGSSEEV